MVVVSRQVHIKAPVPRVFALIADPLARARLNPEVSPIDVRVEGDGPMAVGSRIHFQLKSGDRMMDYRAEVREFVPERRIVTVAQTKIPFEVRLETSAENGGTRLTQTESFEPSEDMLQAELTPVSRLAWLRYALALFGGDPLEQQRAEQEQLLAKRLGEKLESWLAAIKRELERGDNTNPRDV